MLKFFAPGIAIIVASLIVLGCKEEDDRPSVNFVSTSLETSESDSYAKLGFSLDQPAPVDVIITFEFGGSAVHGKDYSCSNEITIRKGQKAGELRLEILDDNEYELVEETIVVSIVDAGENVKIGKKNSATAIVSVDAAPRLTISLTWTGVECKDVVDMDLGLFRGKYRGDWIRSSLTSISKDSGSEELVIPALETSGFFGLAYRYTSGDCRELPFTVTMKCYNCTLNGKPNTLIFKGVYTSTNLNTTNYVQIIQDFEQNGLDFLNFSDIEVPLYGSRSIRY